MLGFDVIARREQRRQAWGSKTIADVAEPIAGGWMCRGEPGSWINQAAALGYEGRVSDADLDRLIAFYADHGIEPAIEVCPFAHPSLVIGLGARGFQVRGFTHVLARTLDEPPSMPHRWPEGLDVKVVDPQDDATVMLFAQVLARGFGESEPIPNHMLELTVRILQQPECEGLLATVEGSPAGGGLYELSEACAGLFSASVLPEFRRRGIQQALIARRLERIKSRGGDLATIQSAPGIATVRNARRMGFWLAFTKIEMHRPAPGLVPSP